jgi:hypothetical protein
VQLLESRLGAWVKITGCITPDHSPVNVYLDAPRVVGFRALE